MASDSRDLERYSPHEIAAFYQALGEARAAERSTTRKRARSVRRELRRTANGEVHLIEEEWELNDDSYGGGSPYQAQQDAYDSWANQPWFTRIFGN